MVMKDSRKLIGKIIALMMAVSLLPSCSVKESQTTTPSESVTTEAPTTSETTTVPETTETQDLNETLPTTTKVPLDVIEGDKGYFTFGFADLGFDNPEIEKVLRELTGDENITFYDVGYLPAIAKRKIWGEELIYANYDKHRNDLCSIEELENGARNYPEGFILYVLKSLNRRYVVDEIPYSFFEEYYPDYLAMCTMYEDENGLRAGSMNPQFSEYVADLEKRASEAPFSNPENWPVLMFDDMEATIRNISSDEVFREYERYCLFYELTQYNSYRIGMLYGSPKTVQQGRTIDGRNALTLVNSKIEIILYDAHRVPALRGIEDLYTPIDSEILKAGGIDEEGYAKLFDLLFTDYAEAKVPEKTS